MLKNLIGSAAVFALPIAVAADTGLAVDGSGGAFGRLVENILAFSNNTLIPFILGIGFLVFVWGMFRYFIAGGANDEAKEQGKSLMVYATLGFVFVIIFWGIINLVETSTGLTDTAVEAGLNEIKNVEITAPAGGDE